MKYIVAISLLFIFTGCFEFPPSGVLDWESFNETLVFDQLSSYDIGSSIITDTLGNIYITGSTTNSLEGNPAFGEKDAYLMKFGYDGEKKWTKQIGTAGNDEGTDLVVDKAGNIYVVGTTSSILDANYYNGKTDMFLTKFLDNGEKQWTKQIGTAENDEGTSITIDSEDNIYTLGTTEGSFDEISDIGISNIFIGKFDKEGNQKWIKQVRTYNTSYAGKILTDIDGNIVVTEKRAPETINLIKFDNQGDELWKRSSQNEDISNNGFININAKGEIYLIGTTYISKYKSTGSKLWEIKIPTSEESVIKTVKATELDKNDNIFITGYKHKTQEVEYSADSNIFIDKYDLNGNHILEKDIGTASDDFATALTIDKTGSVFITGNTYGSIETDIQALQSDLFLIGLNNNCGTLYTHQYSSRQKSIITSLVVKENENENENEYDDYQDLIYTSGYTEGMLTRELSKGKNDAFITWENRGVEHIGTEEDDKGTSMTLDKNSVMFLTGTTKGQFENNELSGERDLFLTSKNRYRQLWTVQFGTDRDDNSSAVINSNNDIFVVGETEGSFDIENREESGYSIFVAKFTKLGEKLWIKQFSVGEKAETSGAVADSKGNIFITGETYGEMENNSNSGKSDIFLMKIDSSGNKLWTKQWGSKGVDRGTALTVDNNSDIYVTGFIESDRENDTDIFITKFDNEGKKLWNKEIGTTSDDKASAIVSDIDNNIFVTGNTKGNLYEKREGECEIFLTRLTEDGKIVEEKQFHSYNCENSSAIALNGNDKIYIAGYIEKYQNNDRYSGNGYSLFVGYVYY